MSKPHKHAELIKAWADGAQIQCFQDGRWVSPVNPKNPMWSEEVIYRIKPLKTKFKQLNN